jgi:hypothetical protein
MENQRRHDMILQEGRYYRARGGEIYGPLIRGEDSEWPFYDVNTGDSWRKDGTLRLVGESRADLISEITCVIVDPVHAVPSPDATPKVDRVVLASKILPRLAPDLAPSMAARQALQYADAFLKEIEND